MCGRGATYFSKRVAVGPVHWVSVEGASPGVEVVGGSLFDMAGAVGIGGGDGERRLGCRCR